MINSDSALAKPFNIFAALLTLALLIGGIFPYPEVSEDLVLFIGRFHPLVVHMPIGFITAVFLLQLVALFTRSDLRVGIGVLLWFTMIAGILSAVIGTLLAIPGGYEEKLLGQHRWLGIGTSIVCIWMLAAHRSQRTGSGIVYSIFLLTCMGLVGATGHWGGALTHGEDYLTAYLPEALGGAPKPEPVDPGTKEDAAIYGRVIQPLMEAKCVACHSPAKSNGDLRLHSFEALMEGGKHGPSVVVGKAAESLLIQRAQLPLEHKEHMPPKGKVQFSEAEVELLSWWIDQGASERMNLDTDLPTDDAIGLMETALGFLVAAPKLEMLSWEETVEASTSLHNNPAIRIRRLALDTPALDVLFEPTTNNVDDLIAQLAPVKANVLLLDLGNTVFTDAALAQIGTFGNLEQLRLQNTSVTDERLKHLENLRQLRKLNLYGTQITDAAFEALTKLPKLRKVNTFGTEVNYEAAEAFIANMENEGKKRKLEQAISELKSKLTSMKVEVVGVEKKDPKSLEPSPELFDDDQKKYGERLNSKSTASVSSTTPFDPPGGLSSLVADKGSDAAFAFHTANEKNPWVRFTYDQAITLNAIHVENRPDVPQRAEGLMLESSNAAAADHTQNISNTTDTKLTEYPFGKSLKGRYVVMRMSSSGTANPGGSELALGRGNAETYRDKVLALNPTVYYTFDPGDLVDADTVKNLGSLANSASLSGGAAFGGAASGLSGGSLSIANSKQMLLVDNGAIDLNETWTISAWYQNLHGPGTFRTLTRAEKDGNDHQVIVNSGSSDLGVWNNGANDNTPGGFRDSGHDLPSGNGAWHHLVAVGTGGDAGQTDFYIDGAHVGTADQGSSGNIHVIGNYQGGGQPFAQAIDEFAVFNTALTPDQIATLASTEQPERTMLPKPVKATASTEFSNGYLVGNLFDGAPSLKDVGTATKLGRNYAGKGMAPHVVVYDMGSSVTFDRIFYAQRPVNGRDHIETIEFWVTDTDPGAASNAMPIFAGKGWQEVYAFEGDDKTWSIDLTHIPAAKRTARDFRLIVKKDPNILHLKQVLMWAHIPSPMVSIDALDKNKKKYGSRINTQAKVTVSSTTQFDPPNGLKKLVQDSDNGLPFAFHTEHESSPWVQFEYPADATLNGISIINRRDGSQERAASMTLEGSKDGHIWEEIWKPASPEKEWHVDLTTIAPDKRKRKFFRLVLNGDATFHLAQVRLWGHIDKPPLTAKDFDANKKVFGERLNEQAEVTVSSTTPHDPPNGLKALVQNEDNGLPFAFHTQHEEHPWAQLRYKQPIILNAMSIRNRGNLHERADGLTLESSSDGKTWQEIWKSPGIQPAWHVDLSHLAAERRKAPYFRLIIAHPGPATLHLGQVRLWGTQTAVAPAKAAPPPKAAPPAKAAPKPAAPAKAETAKPTAPAITGQGAWKYKAIPDWGDIPGHDHIGTTNGDIVVDKSGKVYVSTDGPNGLIVYQEDGTFIKSFGAPTRFFHGMNLYEENGKEYIYAAAMGAVLKLDLEGNVVQKIEGAKQPAGHTWAKATAVAVSPNGDIFIADGYGSSVIFKYDSKGTFIKKFGLRGKADGQFIVSHGLAIDARNPDNMLLMVCDRENRRLQHFDLDGNFVEVIINDLRQPCSASLRGDFVLVAELGGRAVIIDKNHQVVSVLGDNPKLEERANFGVPPKNWIDGVFTAPHGCSFDAKGNCYIQDWNKWGRITKLVRVNN